jgi:E3 ubiquitin-protein ligase RNF115/126
MSPIDSDENNSALDAQPPPPGMDVVGSGLTNLLTQVISGLGIPSGGRFDVAPQGAMPGISVSIRGGVVSQSGNYVAGGGAMESLLNTLLQQSENGGQRSRAASKTFTAKLPRVRMEPAKDDASRGAHDCAVCKENFAPGVEVVRLPCEHFYHEACIMPWLESHNSCPVCRHELPIEEDDGERARDA